MPKVKLVAILAGVIALVAGIVVIVVHYAHREPGLYAYVRASANRIAGDDEFVVMREDQAIAHRRGIFGAGHLYDRPVWTFDGRYVAILAYKYEWNVGSKPSELVVVDVTNGSARTIPCADCAGYVPIGGSDLIVSVQQQLPQGQRRAVPDIRRIDLGGNNPPVRFTTELPAVDFGSVDLYASIPGTALAELSNIFGRDEQSQLFLIDASGSVRPAGNVGENLGITVASAVQNKSGQSKFAAFALTKVNAEGSAHRVFLVNPTDGTQTDIDTSPIRNELSSPAGFEDVVPYTTNLWSDSDGALYATWVAISDDGKWGSGPRKTAPTIWRLDGNVWKRTSGEPTLAARMLSTGRVMILPDDDDNPGGRLYFETGGERKIIAEAVTHVVAPTASKLPGWPGLAGRRTVAPPAPTSEKAPRSSESYQATSEQVSSTPHTTQTPTTGCVSQEALKDLILQSQPFRGPILRLGAISCYGDWAVTLMASILSNEKRCNGDYCWTDSVPAVFRRSDGTWQLEHIFGTSPCLTDSERAAYQDWPPEVRKVTHC